MIERPDDGWYLKKVPFRFYVARTNWATKLSQLEKMNADEMVLLTFSLSNDERWIDGILRKMSEADMQTKIVCNSKFSKEASEIAENYDISVYHHENIHAKMVWFDNGIVWFGSQNMVKTSNIEFLCRVKDKEIADKIRSEYIQNIIMASDSASEGKVAVSMCPNCEEIDVGGIKNCPNCGWSFNST